MTTLIPSEVDFRAEVDGATVVIGAYQHDPIDPDSDPDSPSYLLDAGAAYVFTRDSGGVWDIRGKADRRRRRGSRLLRVFRGGGR